MLSSAGIPHAVERDDGGFTLLAPPDQAPYARAALAAYDEESRREPPAAPPDVTPYPWMSGIAAGLVILWLFSVTGTPCRGPSRPPFFTASSARSAACSASSAIRSTMALMRGLTASMRARQLATASREEISRARIARARSAAPQRQRSFVIRLHQ